MVEPPRRRPADPARGDRVGRGGAKLEAALARFGLAGAVRGARAIDVGASTGGFTETLLAHGASHVTAIDVGHGQLHPRLRDDPRVESLERANLKTLALDRAPGPFDFFGVDVSFVAARSMLRGLAFRLRPGAQGVVLLKPQFELPAHRVRGGDVSAPALRAEALVRFRAKAESLGFRVLEAIDSPVAGSSGTVERLLHLVFEGRSERLPGPGERRTPRAGGASETTPRTAGVPETAPRASTAPETTQRARGARERAARDAGALPFSAREHAWFAVAAPGVEQVVAHELAALPGVAAARAVPGGVEFDGTLETGLHANLALRSASRVLLRLGTIEAKEFSVLRRRAGGLPFEEVVPAGAEIEVSASTSHCRLHHTGALAETVTLAARDRLRRRGRAGAAETPPGDAGGAPRATILLRGADDRFTVSADASGELLHRRGWRLESGSAPLRETLASALLALCAWDPATPLVDPMCGAGTLAIEAAELALGRAPGLGRTFACEAWPATDPALGTRLREKLRDAARATLPSPIVASDADEAAIAAAQRNAERAGVAALLRFATTPLAELRAPRGAGRGLVLVNPPWGRRLQSERAARDTYATLGRVLRERFHRWRAGIVVADPRHADALRMKPAAVHRLASGGLRVRLLVFEVGSEAVSRRAEAG